MRRRCRVSLLSMRRWPSHPGDQHHTLRPTDRDDPQFRSVVLVDGYQQLRVGDARVAAVTSYPPPEHAPVVAPPSDRGDFICVQWALAAADGTNEPLTWICDVSYERYPEFALQLAGRVDSIVVRRMRSVELLLVLDVATSSDWSRDNVRLVVPNDKAMWSAWS
jgi:hypothetical protein